MDREYTQLTYTTPVEEMPKTEEVLGLPTLTAGLGTILTLWGCPDCGAIVWDQRVHNRWHARR